MVIQVRNIFQSFSRCRLITRNIGQVNANKSESWDSQLHANQNESQKVLKVAIVGMPNAGKSSVINILMDRKVCAASAKVHTTRVKSRAIFTQDSSQIIFLDTPGLVNDREKKKHKLANTFVTDIESSLHQADTIAVIHDVSNIHVREKLDIKIVKLLEKYNKINSFLILNKIDLLKSKRKLLEVTRLLTENSIDGKPMPGPLKKREASDFRGWPNFKEVFMISALTGDGLDSVRNYLLSQAKPGKWIFPENTWTDQLPEQIVLNAVKATFLDFLQQEIPYSVTPKMEFLDINKDGVVSTVVLVECPSKRIANLIAGASDGRLRQITEAVQKNLQDCFQNFVRLKIVLQSKEK